MQVASTSQEDYRSLAVAALLYVDTNIEVINYCNPQLDSLVHLLLLL